MAKINDEDRAAAVDAVRRGVCTMKEAGDRLGVTKQAVYRWCRAAGVEVMPRIHMQADLRRAKARELKNSGLRKNEIRKRLGVSSRTIWLWLKDTTDNNTKERKL